MATVNDPPSGPSSVELTLDAIRTRPLQLSREKTFIGFSLPDDPFNQVFILPEVISAQGVSGSLRLVIRFENGNWTIGDETPWAAGRDVHSILRNNEETPLLPWNAPLLLWADDKIQLTDAAGSVVETLSLDLSGCACTFSTVDLMLAPFDDDLLRRVVLLGLIGPDALIRELSKFAYVPDPKLLRFAKNLIYAGTQTTFGHDALEQHFIAFLVYACCVRYLARMPSGDGILEWSSLAVFTCDLIERCDARYDVLLAYDQNIYIISDKLLKLGEKGKVALKRDRTTYPLDLSDRVELLFCADSNATRCLFAPDAPHVYSERNAPFIQAQDGSSGILFELTSRSLSTCDVSVNGVPIRYLSRCLLWHGDIIDLKSNKWHTMSIRFEHPLLRKLKLPASPLSPGIRGTLASLSEIVSLGGLISSSPAISSDVCRIWPLGGLLSERATRQALGLFLHFAELLPNNGLSNSEKETLSPMLLLAARNANISALDATDTFLAEVTLRSANLALMSLYHPYSTRLRVLFK